MFKNRVICANTLIFSLIKKTYGLTTADLTPDFDCKLITTGMDPTMGNGVNVATLNFEKSDGSAISEEEFAAYVAKIYPIVKKVSPTGMVHCGPGMNMDRSAEDARKELPLSEAISWGKAVLCIPTGVDVNCGYQHFSANLHADSTPNNIVLRIYRHDGDEFRKVECPLASGVYFFRCE